ncbi:MAG: hypothetical protein RJB08_1231 [Actinomycetota bacterium]|jgi:hypothetical protein
MPTHAVTLVDVPRPFLDIITSTSQALSVFSLSVQRPFRPQCLVLLVDAARRGVGLHSSDGVARLRDEPTRWGRSIGHHVAGVASDNPLALGCYVMTVEPDATPSPDDAERWFAMADICDRAGIVLIDWCVRGFATAGARFAGQGAVWCPKHVAGLG